MKLISTVFGFFYFVLVSVDASLAEGSKIEANHGENVALAFPMDKAEEADRLRIIFEEETTKKMFLVAQKCAPHEGCDNVDTPGVSLIFEIGCLSVIIQKVNISRSGLYIAQACFGKDVIEVIATLAVNKAPVSSTVSPPHSSSSPTPAHSSQPHRRYALITAVIFIIIIIIICIICFCRWRRITCVQKKELGFAVIVCPELELLNSP
ncbi:uncharacterized protein LOC120471128 [Pimephales promelas]|uniref:uncharacterized protein LOC120471128 n=1 Tax=Pimephales promelas TaxID=90988 RepID=UPI0019557077|nr:uncharacterized protein LOC120471128 [Pimephales promelas]KAG1932435.1 hypothetical protein F2P79_021246 [Pimephales promelas]